MQQILIKLAEQLNSAVFILLSLLFVAFWAVYKITQMFTQWQEQRSGYERLEQEQRSRYERLEQEKRKGQEQMEQEQRGRYEQLKQEQRSGYERLEQKQQKGYEQLEQKQQKGYERLEQKQQKGYEQLKQEQRSGYERLEQEQRSGYERLSKNLHELREDVGTIRARLDFLFQKQSRSSAVVSSSPIQMTAVGKKISACIDAPGIIDAHWDSLCKWALADNPKHPYDIQLAAFTAVEKHLIELLSEDQLDQAKAQALEYGIPLDNALAVVGVLLRDKLLKQQGHSTPQTAAAKSTPPD